MLSIVSLKKAIVDKLKTLDIKIVVNEVRSGFDKPAFFIQLIPISIDTYVSMQERVITVNIHYFSEEKTDIANLKMIDTLNNLFINNIQVEDRTLTLYDKRQELEDNVLQYKFDLKFTEGIENEIGNEFMLSSDFDMKIN